MSDKIMISYISFLLVILGDQMLKGFHYLSPLSKKVGWFSSPLNQPLTISWAALYLSLSGESKEF